MYSLGMLASFLMAGYRMAESVDDGLLCSCDIGSCISYQLVVSRLSSCLAMIFLSSASMALDCISSLHLL